MKCLQGRNDLRSNDHLTRIYEVAGSRPKRSLSHQNNRRMDHQFCLAIDLRPLVILALSPSLLFGLEAVSGGVIADTLVTQNLFSRSQRAAGPLDLVLYGKPRLQSQLVSLACSLSTFVQSCFGQYTIQANRNTRCPLIVDFNVLARINCSINGISSIKNI
jgi:hypothetical protein